jgi:hypothetical protein
MSWGEQWLRVGAAFLSVVQGAAPRTTVRL